MVSGGIVVKLMVGELEMEHFGASTSGRFTWIAPVYATQILKSNV